MQLLLFMYVAAGLLLIALSLPLAAGKIKPNPFYGFRVNATLDDEPTWYRVNRYAGLWLLVIGVIVTLAAILIYQLPGFSVDTYAYACLAVFVISFAIGMVQSWRYMKSLSG